MNDSISMVQTMRPGLTGSSNIVNRVKFAAEYEVFKQEFRGVVDGKKPVLA